jgi:hypothetical protein
LTLDSLNAAWSFRISGGNATSAAPCTTACFTYTRLLCSIFRYEAVEGRGQLEVNWKKMRISFPPVRLLENKRLGEERPGCHLNAKRRQRGGVTRLWSKTAAVAAPGRSLLLINESTASSEAVCHFLVRRRAPESDVHRSASQL